MLQLSPLSIIYVATIYVDFRKGLDSLIALCRQEFKLEPLDGALFLFYNRSKTTIKIISYDGQGFWLCSKRLSSGKFKYAFSSEMTYKQLCYRTLQILIHNGDPVAANLSQDWRPLLNA